MGHLENNIDYYRKIALKQPSGLTQGIYFSLSADEYHDDPAFSHSGMVDILKHPYFYWVSSPLNPKRKKRKQTDAMWLGELSHIALLEPNKFSEKYRTPFEPWSSDKVTLTSSQYEKITAAITELGATREVYFSDGYPEVSIFWIDPLTGLRLKARFDWLRTDGAVDRKNIKEITDDVIGRAIFDYGYDIQHELYRDGMAAVKAGLNSGTMKAYGDCEQDWLDRFKSDPYCGFCFLFQRSMPPFVFRYEFLEQQIMDNAQICIADAKQIFLDYIAEHGLGPWPAGRAEPGRFPSEKIPFGIYNRTNNRKI